jgi:protein-disulfide isomerase
MEVSSAMQCNHVQTNNQPMNGDPMVASPPRDTTTALAAADHSQGNDEAAVTLIEYGDYECPACIQAEPLTRHLVDSFGSRMRFVFRHFPLTETHPHAELAAEAAEAAAAQGRFWPMHHLLFQQEHHLGLRATPSFILNDAFVDVSFGFERLEAAIHHALAGRQPPSASR